MIGIKAISSYIPSESLDNLLQARALGESEEFIHKNIGALQLPRMQKDLDTSDLAVSAIKRLVELDDLNLKLVDGLIVVTQNGDAEGIPHTAAIIHGKMGLKEGVAAFDVSLGCSGYVYGLSIVKGVMEQAGLKNALLVTADPYSKIINPKDRVTSLLFGDAATATWLSDSGDWRFGQPLLDTDGSKFENLMVNNNYLSMNGRQVFNFASKKVPKQIREYMRRNNLEETDIDYFCLHQGSAAIIDAIAKQFPNVSTRFINNIQTTGNTVSSSIPILLEKLIMSSGVNKILICGFGVGLSWATNVLYK